MKNWILLLSSLALANTLVNAQCVGGWTCRDGECTFGNTYCNGITDCGDESDELVIDCLRKSSLRCNVVCEIVNNYCIILMVQYNTCRLYTVGKLHAVSIV